MAKSSSRRSTKLRHGPGNGSNLAAVKPIALTCTPRSTLSLRCAAGQLSQRLHLLRLGELLLCALQLRPCFPALGGVAHDLREPDKFAFLVADGVDHYCCKKQGSVLADTPAVLRIASRGCGRGESAFGSARPAIGPLIETPEMTAR